MKLLVLRGDGIGPEIVSAALTVSEALDRKFNLGLEYEDADFGLSSIEKNGESVPQATLDKARASDGIICGPHDSVAYPPPHDTAITPAGRLRKELDLYANIRPARNRLGVPAHIDEMDLVVCRENTEGFYADRSMFAGLGEFMPTPDMALSIRKITRQGSARIAEFAFQIARQRRSKVTVMHKGNVLTLTDGLFRETAFDVATRYPDVTVDEVLADAIFALVVRRPQDFDVILTTNLYGDFLSDLTSELVGGLGVGGSINAGHDICAAQAAHGSAPDIMGQNVANPTAMILSVAMLFDWLGGRHERSDLKDAARCLEAALDQQLADDAGRTRDLGGPLATDAFADVLADRIVQA